MKYAFIDRNRSRWPVCILCETLEVSPSGYHQRQRRSQVESLPPRRLNNATLLVQIKRIHAQVKGEYGWPRMWKELLKRGHCVGKERVRKQMALHGIQARHKRKYIATTNSNHHLPVAPNLLKRNFVATALNQSWSMTSTAMS
ncbi:hypothetical protein AGMMS49960_17520 [Betaproteobacteria bacterium]|nr:hypothetical protein AGMMS49543_09790 [Betaproteobacteria bacterium]GHU03337.1 hypothetical protein AGMMS49960_17520 [Betaproteobacteria bacterium]GHV87455.1 hypothetical protein AGMMS50255_7510 [Spirochaetia bacterium]